MKYLFEKAYRESGKAQKNTADGGGEVQAETRYSIGEIVDQNQKSYGVGVHLDSTLLDGLTPDERKTMVKERIKELGGEVFTAYDSNGNAVNITIAKHNARFKNQSGKNRLVNNDLTTKYIGNEVKQEAVVLIDELIASSKFRGTAPAKHSHGWLDNNGQNAWDAWTTYIQDKNNIIWETTLHIANTANGEKIIYDVVPTKKVGQSGNSDTSLLKNNIQQNGDSVKRSLSDAGKRHNGVALEETSADDLAPVREDLVQRPEAPGSREELAPVGENVRRNDGSAPQEAEAPAGDGLTPAQEEILQMPEENLYAEKLVAKWENSKAEAENLERLREEAVASYDRKVEALQAQYDGKRNKETKTAKDILRRIERWNRLRAGADADYKNVIESGYREGAIKTPAFKMKTGRPDSQRLSGCYQCDSKWMLPGRICFHCPCLRTYCCA